MDDEFTLARRTAFFTIGATMYAMVGILPQLSLSNAEMDYDHTVVVALAEVGKFCLSLGFLTNCDMRSSAIKDNFVGFKEVLVYFSLPAFLYAVSNNLNILLALRMDAATFQVLNQSAIVFTSILWWIVFRKPLSLTQWTAIGILTIGSALTSLQKASGSSNVMGIHSLAGIPLLVVAVASSTVACVSTEWRRLHFPTKIGTSFPGIQYLHLAHRAKPHVLWPCYVRCHEALLQYNQDLHFGRFHVYLYAGCNFSVSFEAVRRLYRGAVSCYSRVGAL